jgi:S-(hydroxymethyl)glutathione dehydrogenase/alcohol dehydrogenase
VNTSLINISYKALVLNEIGTDPSLTKVSLCTKLDPNHVLVKVLFTGICGKQLEEISGFGGLDRYLPHLLGHEGSGIVEAVGSNVTHVAPHDLVVLHWITEFQTPPFKLPSIISLESGLALNAGPITTFAEYSVVLANRVTKVPPDTCPRIAALLGCGLTTGLGAVFNEAKICKLDRVLVVGCGGVGLSVIQGCKIKGLNNIAAIDISQSALLQASLCGATTLINISCEDDLNMHDLKPYTHVFYCIGATQLLSKIHARLSAPSSTYLVGVPHPSDEVTINARHIHQRKALYGSYGGLTRPSVDFPIYLDMINRGILDPTVLLGKTFSIDQSNDAFDAARSGIGQRVQFAF